MGRAIFAFFVVSTCFAADSGAGIHGPFRLVGKPKPSGRCVWGPTPSRQRGECAVYFFGSGQGGSVDANVDRWVGQFVQANGRSSKSAAKIAKEAIHGWPVTTVDVSGAYTGMGGASMSDYRMLAAIVEGPQGSVFFKFTGPAKTIAANQANFDKMLASLQ